MDNSVIFSRIMEEYGTTDIEENIPEPEKIDVIHTKAEKADALKVKKVVLMPNGGEIHGLRFLDDVS